MENEKSSKQLGLFLLVALGVGSMIGGGIFNSPTDLIAKANPQSALIAWGIGGVGIISLALVFQMLSNVRPDLTGGIFTYAQDGFGDFTGFNSAWGYWLSGWLGNIAFIVLIFKTLNDLTGNKNPIVTFVAASVFLWVMHIIQLNGVKGASSLNAIITVAKIIPLLLVIIFGIAIFKSGTFNVANFTTTLASSGSHVSLQHQVSGAMSTILWCFIGVEAATVLSERAKSQKIVGKATVISLLITLALYILISIAAMGSVDAKSLAGATTPLALVFYKTAIGRVGAVIAQVGLIVSLVGSLVSWIMLSAEIPFVAAKGGTMPKWFTKTNKKGVPTNSLILTNVLTQFFLLCLIVPALQKAYSATYTISTACILIPYLFSALFAVKECVVKKLSAKNFIIAIIGCVYSIYVLYSCGIKELGEMLILYAIGIFVFLWAKKEKNEEVKTAEKVAMVIIGAIAVLVIILLATKVISL